LSASNPLDTTGIVTVGVGGCTVGVILIKVACCLGVGDGRGKTAALLFGEGVLVGRDVGARVGVAVGSTYIVGVGDIGLGIGSDFVVGGGVSCWVGA
jgi:hypothetical protein